MLSVPFSSTHWFEVELDRIQDTGSTERVLMTLMMFGLSFVFERSLDRIFQACSVLLQQDTVYYLLVFIPLPPPKRKLPTMVNELYLIKILN